MKHSEMLNKWKLVLREYQKNQPNSATEAMLIDALMVVFNDLESQSIMEELQAKEIVSSPEYSEAHELVMDIMEHSKMSDDSVTAGMKAFERLNNYYLRHKDKL